MIADTALIEKREELKRRLASGEYKTLVDVFLEWSDRLLRKVVHRIKPLSLWLIIVFWSLVFSLITFGAMYITGDLTIFRQVAKVFRLGYGLGLLVLSSLIILNIATVVVINQSIHRIFVLWCDDILDATESMTSLHQFEGWLKSACNLRLHFIVTIFGGLLIGLFVVFNISTLMGEVFVGYGFTFAFIVVNVLYAVFIYQFLMVILLPLTLRQYDLKLFEADPAASELLSHLSSKLGVFVYFIAIYAALNTLVYASPGSFTIGSIVVVLFLWLPIIAMFVLNQTSLASIIRHSKWKTLNEIQSQVGELRATNNLKDKETMEAINRLMDFHDRVEATRNSAIDSSTIINFVNSLLLPLLAFLLGNLDKVLSIFSK